MPTRFTTSLAIACTASRALRNSRIWPDAAAARARLSSRANEATALLLGAGLFLIGLLLQFIRWFALVRAQNLPFSFANALRLGLIGFFFNSFLPTAVGGDGYRVLRTLPHESYRSRALSAVIVERE